MKNRNFEHVDLGNMILCLQTYLKMRHGLCLQRNVQKTQGYELLGSQINLSLNCMTSSFNAKNEFLDMFKE